MNKASKKKSTARDVMSVAIVAIIALMLGVNLFVMFDDEDNADLVGAEAPLFSLMVFEEEHEVELEKYRGQVVVMDFWASWCTSCKEQLPILDKIASDSEVSDDVFIFSVNIDAEAADRAERMKRFIEDVELSMPTAVDTGVAQRSYQIAALPTLVIVDADGVVSHVSQGIHSEASLRSLIEEARGG